MITSPTYTCKIYIAGDINQIKTVCRKFCFDVGLCVTVTPTTYIYTGGEEEGVVVGSINYPRFPAHPAKIKSTAIKLGLAVMKECCQHSFTVETPNKTYWFSRR